MAYQQGQMQPGDELVSSVGNTTLFRRRVSLLAPSPSNSYLGYPSDQSSYVYRVLALQVVRQKEVPFVRKVKVPVTTKRVVQGTVNQTVKVKKLVEVPDFKEVQET